MPKGVLPKPGSLGVQVCRIRFACRASRIVDPRRWPEESGEGFQCCRRVAEFALPQRDRLPAEGAQGFGGLLVPLAGAVALGRPEFRIRRRGMLPGGAIMQVPEASVDEDGLVAGGKDDVGGAGELAAGQTCLWVFASQLLEGSRGQATMEPVAVSGCMEQSAHKKLGLRILATDPAHELRALVGGHAVHASIVHPVFTERHD
jgi:hypothetical protein